MKTFELTLAITSFLLLLTGMVYKRNKKSIFSEPIIGVAAGIFFGPSFFKILDMQEWGSPEKIMKVACQLTISMALLATAFRIPKNYFRKNTNTQLSLILLGMLGMFAISTILMKVIFDFDWLLSMLIAAIITPTDPVIASTIVSGEVANNLLPPRIRNAISFESGANDGMAFPLVMLPILLMEKGSSAITEWLIKSILLETVVAILLGMLIGYGAAKTLTAAKKANLTAKPALLIFSLSLGFFVLGFLEVLHLNAIIGVFCAGCVANHVLSQNEDIEQEEVQESMERVFTLPVFFLFGLILPFNEWLMLGWKAPAIIIGVLLLRRMPVLLAMKPLMNNLAKKDDLLFIGWFGPIGVAALFYTMLAMDKVGKPEIFTIATLVIFSSTIVHGVTGFNFSKWYNRRNGNG